LARASFCAAVLRWRRDRASVTREHRDKRAPGRRVVVIDEAGVKNRDFGRGFGGPGRKAGAPEPGLEGFAGELGQLLGARNAQHLLHHRALKGAAAGPVGELRNRAAELAEQVRIAKYFLAHGDAVLAALDRARPQHQAREVELELVTVMRRVGASDLAKLAAVAQIDHALFLRRAQAAHVAVALVEGVE
jgi:hypothetical protein